MLVTSIFSFFHNVFYLYKNKSEHFSNVYFVIFKCFEFGRVQNFAIGKRVKELTRILLLRRQLLTLSKTSPCFSRVCSTSLLKTLWEKEKMLLTINFSFSHSVFKRLVLQTCKNQDLFGKGLRSINTCNAM